MPRLAAAARVLPLVLAVAAADLSSRLQISFDPDTPAAAALFPPSTARLPAPLAIRYLFLHAVASWELAAACSPSSLSFFGVRDRIPPALCAGEARLVTRCLLLYHTLRRQYPPEAAAWARYLAAQGLAPDHPAPPPGTPLAWARRVAGRAERYFADDGWNSRGDRDRAVNRRPFHDYTAYRPVNRPGDHPRAVRRPLRWQPLEARGDATGAYATQQFACPQLGRSGVKTLFLTRSELRARKARSPYFDANTRRGFSPQDEPTVQKLLKDLFDLSAALTPHQRFLAYWWENKRRSLNAILPYYASALDLSQFEVAALNLAMLVAMHDAMIVAWRGKVALDLVRPGTLIREAYGARRVRAFVSEDVGVQEIKAQEFEPLVPVQAHAEHPSGSALLCRAGLDTLGAGLARLGHVPGPYERAFRPGAFGFPTRQAAHVRFANLSEMAASCKESRLWAGVHFPPSVAEGERLAAGIGELALKHVFKLVDGDRPEPCSRCDAVGA